MMRTVFLRALAFAALWWILAEGRLDGWLLGSVAVVAATWASITLQPPGKLPLRLAGLVGFVRFFLWNSLRGGLQVAAMALRGRAPHCGQALSSCRSHCLRVVHACCWSMHWV
jgi:multicomponent Na+:H+ antiporter subunit E